VGRSATVLEEYCSKLTAAATELPSNNNKTISARKIHERSAGRKQLPCRLMRANRKQLGSSQETSF